MKATSTKRSRATLEALRREGHQAASPEALAQHAREVAPQNGRRTFGSGPKGIANPSGTSISQPAITRGSIMMKSNKKIQPLRSRQIQSGRPTGRISRGGKGIGAITQNMLDKRSQELALIAGRAADQVTPSDYAQAKRELSGSVRPATETSGEAVTPWDVAPVSTARQRPKSIPQDDRNTETLVNEGVAEALHDQMVTERKETSKRLSARKRRSTH